MKADETTLQKCLFFTSNRLSNVLRRIANDICSKTGIALPHVYLLIVVNQYKGISRFFSIEVKEKQPTKKV